MARPFVVLACFDCAGLYVASVAIEVPPEEANAAREYAQRLAFAWTIATRRAAGCGDWRVETVQA